MLLASRCETAARTRRPLQRGIGHTPIKDRRARRRPQQQVRAKLLAREVAVDRQAVSLLEVSDDSDRCRRGFRHRRRYRAVALARGFRADDVDMAEIEPAELQEGEDFEAVGVVVGDAEQSDG